MTLTLCYFAHIPPVARQIVGGTLFKGYTPGEEIVPLNSEARDAISYGFEENLTSYLFGDCLLELVVQ